MVEVSDSSHFSTLLNSNRPMIAKFGNSATCPPCRANEPIFKHYDQVHGAKVIFANVDLGKLQSLGGQYSVRSMPTFVFFVGGMEVKRTTGAGSFESDADNFIAMYGKTVFEQSRGKALGGGTTATSPWANKNFKPGAKQSAAAATTTTTADGDVPEGMKMVCEGDICRLVPLDEPKQNNPCGNCNIM